MAEAAPLVRIVVKAFVGRGLVRLSNDQTTTWSPIGWFDDSSL
jgi:hypothetical protein